MRIKKGDQVEVIAGNFKGVRGEVMRVYPGQNRLTVKGVNLVKKHQRPQPGTGRGQVQGGIIEFEAPIDASNVMLVDPETNEPTRVGIRVEEDGRKVRYAKRSGAVID
jgi:large subunit ribosomal protein L24